MIYNKRNNYPEDVDQKMQAMLVKTIKEMVRIAVLQVITKVYNLRMAAIEQSIMGLTISMNNYKKRENSSKD